MTHVNPLDTFAALAQLADVIDHARATIAGAAGMANERFALANAINQLADGMEAAAATTLDRLTDDQIRNTLMVADRLAVVCSQLLAQRNGPALLDEPPPGSIRQVVERGPWGTA